MNHNYETNGRRHSIRCMASQHLTLASTVLLPLPMLPSGRGGSHLQVSPHPSLSGLSPRCCCSQFRAYHFTQCVNPCAQELDESTWVPGASLDLLRISSLRVDRCLISPAPRQFLGKWMTQHAHSSSLSGRDQPYQVDSLGICPRPLLMGRVRFLFQDSGKQDFIADSSGESPEG